MVDHRGVGTRAARPTADACRRLFHPRLPRAPADHDHHPRPGVEREPFHQGDGSRTAAARRRRIREIFFLSDGAEPASVAEVGRRERLALAEALSSDLAAYRGPSWKVMHAAQI